MKAQSKFVELDSMYLGLIAYIKKVSDAYINRFGNNSMAVYSVKDLTDNCPSFNVMNFWKYGTSIKKCDSPPQYLFDYMKEYDIPDINDVISFLKEHDPKSLYNPHCFSCKYFDIHPKVKYNNKSVLCFYPSFVDGTRFSWMPLGSIVKDMFNEDKLDIQLKDAHALKRDGKLLQIQDNISLLYEMENLRQIIEGIKND